MPPRMEPRGADEVAPRAYGRHGAPRASADPAPGDRRRAHDPDGPQRAGREPDGPARGEHSGPTWSPAEESEGVLFLDADQFAALVRAQPPADPPD